MCILVEIGSWELYVMRSGHCRAGFSPIWSRIVEIVASALVFGFLAGAQAPPAPKPAAPRKQAAQNPPSRHEQQAPPAKPLGEDDIRRQFQGKTVYLRGGYLDNELHFDREGRLVGSSPQASYTLSMVEIDKVQVSKHKVQLQGIRFGLHFLGASPTEDPLSASDKVRITPKKKVLKITIQRADVAKPKKDKRAKDDVPGPVQGSQSAPALESSEGPAMTQERANQMLRDALDRVFSPGLDDKMVSSMPDFWQVYYKATAAKSAYKPADPSVHRQSTVDQKARLLTIFQPDSNDFAQKAGVAGVALYHVVVGADGKPAEIAVGRPIGFGLDENAVAAIRKAAFAPAMKDGKPVPVLLDLLVQFRIYSKRTGAPGPEDKVSATLSEPEAPSLPGPYSTDQTTAKQP
jgi:TonB family protein